MLTRTKLLVFSLLDRRARHALCQIALGCGRGLGACGLGRRVRGEGLLLLLLGLLVFCNLLDVAVLVVVAVANGREALLALRRLGLAVCLRGGLGGLALLLCELLVLDVLGGLTRGVSLLCDVERGKLGLPLAMPTWA